MTAKPRAIQLGRMLDLCEDLQRIRNRIADPETNREERERLRRQTERRHNRLARDLQSYRGRGPIARLLRSHRLDAHEFEVMAVLLQRAVRAEAPDMEGRLILGSIFETSYGVLSGLPLLAEDARLRTSGLVRPADDQPSGGDVLETRFRLSEEALVALREEVGGRRGARRRAHRQDGYRTQREYLLDLRVLHNHYLRRSQLIFDPARWDSLSRRDQNAATLNRRIDALWSEIRSRIAGSDRADAFPLVRLQRELGLRDAEVVIVVHLLFQEVYAGEAEIDVADLLRLVSTSEADLLAAGHLIHRDGSLRRGDVISIEPFVENRDLTGQAKLTDWMVNCLLDDRQRHGRIHPDERLRWHDYLSGLHGSDEFYRDLDA